MWTATIRGKPSWSRSSLGVRRLSSDLPQIGYLVAIEYVFFVVCGLALFIIFISLVTHLKSGNPALARELTLGSRVAYPLAVAITAAVVVYVYAF